MLDEVRVLLFQVNDGVSFHKNPYVALCGWQAQIHAYAIGGKCPHLLDIIWLHTQKSI